MQAPSFALDQRVNVKLLSFSWCNMGIHHNIKAPTKMNAWLLGK